MNLAFDSVLCDYELLLSLTDDLTVGELCRALEKYSRQNPEWLNNIYAQSIDLDMNLSSIVLYTQALGIKLISLEKINYLRFKKDGLINVVKLLSKYSSIETVDVNTINALADRVDKELDKTSREYKVFRLICIARILGLHNITSSISCFTLSQELLT